jgi:hypothetical protein
MYVSAPESHKDRPNDLEINSFTKMLKSKRPIIANYDNLPGKFAKLARGASFYFANRNGVSSSSAKPFESLDAVFKGLQCGENWEDFTVWAFSVLTSVRDDYIDKTEFRWTVMEQDRFRHDDDDDFSCWTAGFAMAMTNDQ